ncbi:MAG: hypothetical protein EXR99_15165 [Gemmataceae bacterium]|nr:hypothetical protein [Gemmataceae bacterium]
MPMERHLSWIDYAIIIGYLAAMVVIGVQAGRKKKDDDEYFLAGRQIPWFAIGLSIVATLISSLSYISEPGEVFLSGLTNFSGKLIAIFLETGFVLFLFIPFLMRFRFTSAYEYLGYRFNTATRTLGVVFFSLQTVAWMGFVILAMARTMTEVTGMNLSLVILTVGFITTLYTMVGGYRGVVWTDVAQFVLMFGGALGCVIYVMVKTGSWPGEWLTAAMEHHANKQTTSFISFDPFHRSTVVTFALTMFVWHVCIHLGNQMTVQRYFSTSDLPRARKSFLLAVLGNLVINALLVLVGLAILYETLSAKGETGFSEAKKADMIFPRFMVDRLPPGLCGAVITAVLAAAMSTISSGFNSLATVLAVEKRTAEKKAQAGFAFYITLAAGALATLLAFAIDLLVKDRNIVEMMPRSFNCFTAPLGGLFLLGIFVPWVTARAAFSAAIVALITAILLAFGKEILGLEKNVSFTLVMPGSLLMMLLVALVLSKIVPGEKSRVQGLTWFSRKQRPQIDPTLVAQKFPGE